MRQQALELPTGVSLTRVLQHDGLIARLGGPGPRRRLHCYCDCRCYHALARNLPPSQKPALRT